MKSALFLLLIGALFSTQTDNFSKKRVEMVKNQIQSRGVKNAAVLDAMRKVPRHRFVPSDKVSDAYGDGPLPIGYGQTISQPYIVAYMTEIINPKPVHRVLEIGTGSGYQAAVLSEIVSEVYTIEIVDELSKQAASRLANLNYKNVHVKTADGYYGWKEHAPYDAIVVTAAAEHVPPSLIEQLKEGGKMIIPVGSPFMVQELMLIEKSKGKIRTSAKMPVRFVPFTRK
ncbi:protein-L-isoaspartate O-methyltransferase [Flavobacterium enshiense DK69]|uniref:Protein-L-isoaspartate O-methyltransferase n=1 Tax=Flavobacterium enshiense DK69 TaxID=1107311 RepID=V6S7M4_9FLAO|nr:protein-L-isoaspartate(D-aspartate) O-methyltransferase [Flavobacterium enshiense]ESU20405.1 protein-L-isoaspartate O-methyltransferase [Flavobacterium enshiense DK69]KGO95789.1 protein-L-isoaspartate O-methyltransferase [Flavobacterium enshiense DK69]